MLRPSGVAGVRGQFIPFKYVEERMFGLGAFLLLIEFNLGKVPIWNVG